MSKLTASIFFLVLFLGTAFSQQTLNDNQFEGYIILKNGEKKEGIVEIGNINKPWSFQETIKFFDKSLLEKEKVKKDDKLECKPGEVVEYGIPGRRFLFVTYTNNNNVDGNALTSGIGMLKNATQTKFFAELYREGKVSVYRFYNSPPDFAFTSGDEEARALSNYKEKCLREFDILIEKGEEKAKAFDEVNIKKFFKDCEFVVQKYEDKKYTRQPVKGLKSMMKKAMLKGDALAAAAMEMIEDYEAQCAK